MGGEGQAPTEDVDLTPAFRRVAGRQTPTTAATTTTTTTATATEQPTTPVTETPAPPPTQPRTTGTRNTIVQGSHGTVSQTVFE